MSHQPSELADVIADLQAELLAQRAELAAQRADVAKLRAALAAAAATQRRPSRARGLVPVLTLLCVLSLSVAFGPGTRAQTPDGAPNAEQASGGAAVPGHDLLFPPALDDPAPDPSSTGAGAAPDKAHSPQGTGDPLTIGVTNNQASSVTDKTVLINPSSAEVMRTTFEVNNFSTASIVAGLIPAHYRAAIVGSTSGAGTDPGNNRIGVAGFTDRGAGVYGVSTQVGSGVLGVGKYYGGGFKGDLAPLWLVPSATDGPPTTGSHNLGELVVSADGHLWFCRADGTPGTWVRLDLASTFIPLVQK